MVQENVPLLARSSFFCNRDYLELLWYAGQKETGSDKLKRKAKSNDLPLGQELSKELTAAQEAGDEQVKERSPEATEEFQWGSAPRVILG